MDGIRGSFCMENSRERISSPQSSSCGSARNNSGVLLISWHTVYPDGHLLIRLSRNVDPHSIPPAHTIYSPSWSNRTDWPLCCPRIHTPRSSCRDFTLEPSPSQTRFLKVRLVGRVSPHCRDRSHPDSCSVQIPIERILQMYSPGGARPLPHARALETLEFTVPCRDSG